MSKGIQLALNSPFDAGNARIGPYYTTRRVSRDFCFEKNRRNFALRCITIRGDCLSF